MLLTENAVVIKNGVWISLSHLLDPVVLSVNTSKDRSTTVEGPFGNEHEHLCFVLLHELDPGIIILEDFFLFALSFFFVFLLKLLCYTGT